MGGVAALAAAVACGQERFSLVGDFPPDTAFVAAIFLGDTGQRVASTGVIPFASGPSTTTRIPDVDASEVLVYAWDGAALAGILPVDGSRLALPVMRAGPGQPVLPDPIWVGRAQPLGAPLEAASAREALTAPWLAPCPVLAGAESELLADLRCGSRACPARFSQQGCRIPMPLGACAFPDLEVQVDGRGGVVFDGRPGRIDCQPAAAPEPALGSASCDGCRVDLYARPLDPPPPLSIARVQLAPPAPPERRSPPYPGRLTGMAVVDDRVFAALVGEGECPGARIEVVQLDASSMLERWRRRLPGCSQALLLADPLAAGVLVVAQTSTAAWVARLSADGEVVGRQALAEPWDAPVVAIASDPELDRLAILLDRQEGVGRIDLHRLTDLRPAARGLVPGNPLGGLVFGGRSRIFIGTESYVYVVRGEDAVEDGRVSSLPVEGIKAEFHRMVAFPGRLVAIGSGERSGMYAFEEGNPVASGLFFPEPLILTDAVFFPGVPESHSGLAGGFASGQDPETAYLARFAPEEIRFLPVAHPVGVGPVLDLGPDRHGHLWARLPAEGALIRVTSGSL